jgi:GNAT superfamily N-acetyltransferase
MSLSAPQSLGANHQLEDLNCGKPTLTDWLLRYARQAQGSGSAKTFVSCDGDRVAGYFSMTVGQIDTLEAPERIRRGMGQYPIPLVILARLAVDLDYQRQGLGVSLLQDAIRRTVAIAEHAGIRAAGSAPRMSPTPRASCLVPVGARRSPGAKQCFANFRAHRPADGGSIPPSGNSKKQKSPFLTKGAFLLFGGAGGYRTRW